LENSQKQVEINPSEKSPENLRFPQKNHYPRSRNKDRENEPFEVMLRRFFRDVQQSGILTEIKKRRFRDKDVSRKILRQAARRKAARKKIKRGY